MSEDVKEEAKDSAAEIMLAMVLKEVGGSIKVHRSTQLDDIEGIEVVEEMDGIVVRLVKK